MSKKYYVYAYINPLKEINIETPFYTFNYIPFYIGKGCDNRKNITINNAIKNKGNKHINNIVNEILSNNLLPEIVIIKDNLNEKQAFILENYMLNILNINYLTNKIYGQYQYDIDEIDDIELLLSIHDD